MTYNTITLSAELIALNSDLISKQLETEKKSSAKSRAHFRNILMQVQDFDGLVSQMESFLSITLNKKPQPSIFPAISWNFPMYFSGKHSYVLFFLFKLSIVL